MLGGKEEMKGNELKEETLYCVDCDVAFQFTVGEQAYFRSKGLSVPKRCPECRKRRRDSIVRDEEMR